MQWKKALLLGLLPFLIPLSPQAQEEDRIVIFGDSYGEDLHGINEPIFIKLLQQIKENDPTAVIATGNLVLGLTPSETAVGALLKQPTSQSSSKGLVYAKEVYLKQLKAFSDLYNRILPSIPLYPIPGYHEAFGPDSISLFQSHFDIKNARYLDGIFAYTLAIGKAYFVLFSNDYFDKSESRAKKQSLSYTFLDWLNQELREASRTYPFLFVIGHEPAFSTSGFEGRYLGLDKDPYLRDIFWRILKDNDVLAYIASQEHLYDRTNRDGVWHLISGGGGAPLHADKKDRAFHHFLLLIVPPSDEVNPLIRVIDTNGEKRDEFELQTVRNPLYQLRISKLAEAKLPLRPVEQNYLQERPKETLP